MPEKEDELVDCLWNKRKQKSLYYNNYIIIMKERSNKNLPSYSSYTIPQDKLRFETNEKLE